MATPRCFGREIDGNARKKPNFTTLERDRIVGMVKGGCSTAEVVAEFGCDATTVRRIIKKFNTTGSVKDRPCSGRPGILSLY